MHKKMYCISNLPPQRFCVGPCGLVSHYPCTPFSNIFPSAKIASPPPVTPEL